MSIINVWLYEIIQCFGFTRFAHFVENSSVLFRREIDAAQKKSSFNLATWVSVRKWKTDSWIIDDANKNYISIYLLKKYCIDRCDRKDTATQVTITMLCDLYLGKENEEKKKKKWSELSTLMWVTNTNTSYLWIAASASESSLPSNILNGRKYEKTCQRLWKRKIIEHVTNVERETQREEEETKSEKNRSKLRRMKVFPNQITFVWKISAAQRTIYGGANERAYIFLERNFIWTEIRME